MDDLAVNNGLSEAGAARRDAMLRDLLLEVDRVRRMRRARRAAAPVAGVLIVAATGMLLRPWGSATAPQPGPTSAAGLRHVEIVTTRADVLAERVVDSSRLRRVTEVVGSRPIEELASVEVVDDLRLLDTLAEAGLVRGVVRVDGRLRIIEPDGSLFDVPGGVR